jgi:hypothetical protein
MKNHGQLSAKVDIEKIQLCCFQLIRHHVKGTMHLTMEERMQNYLRPFSSDQTRHYVKRRLVETIESIRECCDHMLGALDKI